MENAKQLNVPRPTVAKVGLAISLMGFICIMLVASYEWLQRESKIEMGPVGLEGNILPPGFGSFFRGFLAAIMALCGLVCGLALSGIGVLISLISLVSKEKHIAAAGFMFGIAGPLLLLIVSRILTTL
jgi:hypothetical protein